MKTVKMYIREFQRILEREFPFIISEFLIDFLSVASITTLLSFGFYVVSTYKLMQKPIGLEGVLVLIAFSIVRVLGHFWALRKCYIPCDDIVFVPVLGAYIQTPFPFFERWDEAFSAMGATIWIYTFSLISFLFYLLTDNLTCLLMSGTFLLLGFFALIPITSRIDGGTVIKSLAFSVSRYLGLLYMFIDIFFLPLVIYWFMLQDGPVDNINGLYPVFMAGVQAFRWEYKRLPKFPIEPMRKVDQIKMTSLYVTAVLAFIFTMPLLGTAIKAHSIQSEVWQIARVGLICLICMSIVEDLAIFFITIKRKIFGNI